MKKTTITQYLHRPNPTELGLGNTHETYLLIKKSIDLSEMFPPMEDVVVHDPILGRSYTLKSAFGNEFRVNQMGSIYRDYNVKPGDEIIFTEIKSDDLSEIYLTIRNLDRIIFNMTSKGATIINSERLFGEGRGPIVIQANYNGEIVNLEFEFLKEDFKRSDSPEKTEFYTVLINNEDIQKKNNKDESYYLSGDEESGYQMELSSKCEYNRIVFDGELPKSVKDGIIFPKKKTYKASSLQQIFYGAPGTGKSHAIKLATANKRVIRTTFHPDTDYATFVGAYKPTMTEYIVRDLSGHSIKKEGGNGEPLKESRISYEFVMQSFLQAYVEAWKKQSDEIPQPIFLVIEEINRGNCAQIFGDLFQLLDRNKYGFSDYPILADNDLRKHLSKELSGLNIQSQDWMKEEYQDEGDIIEKVKSGEILLLPDNLYIWATMNTSDQSLFPIDSAFKRRWDWTYTPIADAGKGWKILIGDKSYDWWVFLQKINDTIYDTTQSEDKKLGYFFCKDVDGTISAETFVGKVVFYLWNDVFKDFGCPYLTDTDGTPLTFNKFYKISEEGRTVVNEEKVALFLDNVFKDVKSENKETSE